MIKNLLQKNRTTLLAIVITAAVTSAVASGYFVIKNEKKISNQKVETLQKSIEELQAKNTEYQEAGKEEVKAVPVIETTAQKEPVVKKNVEAVAPIKLEEPEEKTISCLTYANTTVKVSESECDLIKQKNESSKEIDVEYQDCALTCSRVASACLPPSSKAQYDSVFGDGAYDGKVSECQDSRDNCKDDCLDERSDQMKNLWK